MIQPEQIRKLELRDGDVICLPADTTHESVQQFVELLREVHPAKRLLITLNDVRVLDEPAMNAAGWFRK